MIFFGFRCRSSMIPHLKPQPYKVPALDQVNVHPLGLKLRSSDRNGNDDATPFRRCILVGVLSQIGLFTDTYFVLQMRLILFFSVVFQVVL